MLLYVSVFKKRANTTVKLSSVISLVEDIIISLVSESRTNPLAQNLFSSLPLRSTITMPLFPKFSLKSPFFVSFNRLTS